METSYHTVHKTAHVDTVCLHHKRNIAIEPNSHTREHLLAESVRQIDEHHHYVDVGLAKLLLVADVDVCGAMPNTMIVSTSNTTYAIKSASGVDVQIAARRCLKTHPCGVSFGSCRGPLGGPQPGLEVRVGSVTESTTLPETFLVVA